MSLNAFFVRIVALILPGLAGSKIYRKLRGRPKRKDWEDYAEVLIFSVLAYVLLYLVVALLHLWPLRYMPWAPPELTIGKAFFDEHEALPLAQIVAGVALSVAVAPLASLVYQRGWINWVCCRLQVTKRYGDGDIWSYFHEEAPEFVVVRDHKLDLIYFAAVQGFSESDLKRELLLRDVSVYAGEDGRKLYETPQMYLSRKSDDLTIELPTTREEGLDAGQKER